MHRGDRKMAIRNIRINEDPILRKQSKKVEDFGRRTQILIDDMFDTMYDADGVGLAAVQVGVLKQIVVIDTGEEGFEPLVLVNPEIIAEEGEQHTPEGCLSVPGRSAVCRRPNKVTVRAQNRDGEEFEVTGEGLLAKAFSHEIDHLHGILYTDKVEEWLER